MTTPPSTIAVLCDDNLFRIAAICIAPPPNCTRLTYLLSENAECEMKTGEVQCSEQHQVPVRFEDTNSITQVGCQQLYALECSRLPSDGSISLTSEQPICTAYDGAPVRGSVIRHNAVDDAVLIGVTLHTGEYVQIVRNMRDCRFAPETPVSDEADSCGTAHGSAAGNLNRWEEALGRQSAIRRDTAIFPRRKTVSESNTNEVMDDQTAAIVLTSLSASSTARADLLQQKAVAMPSALHPETPGHVAGPLKRGMRQRCSNSLSEPYSASALRSRFAAASQAQNGGEREREPPLMRYPPHLGSPAFLVVAQQRNEQSARTPVRLAGASGESAGAYRAPALFQPAIVQAVPICVGAAPASFSSSAPSTFAGAISLQQQQPGVLLNAAGQTAGTSRQPTVGSGSSSPREPNMPCAVGANVSVVSRDEGIGADIEMDDSSCATVSASTTAMSISQSIIPSFRFECTWRGCTSRSTTRQVIEQHIREAHLSEEERGKNEEEFYYNEIDEHDDDECTSESLAADEVSSERRRQRAADDLIDSVAAGFSSLNASSPPAASGVRPPPGHPFIGHVLPSANGPLVLPAALVTAPRNGSPRTGPGLGLGAPLSAMSSGPVKVLRSAPVSILSVTPSAVLTPPNGATPSSWSASASNVTTPLRFMNVYSYQFVPATPSSSWSPHTDRVQPAAATTQPAATLPAGRSAPTQNGSTQNTSASAAASDYDSEQAGDDGGAGGGRRSKSDVKKCRKVYGIENRDKWCLQCKWKKACTRFPD